MIWFKYAKGIEVNVRTFKHRGLPWADHPSLLLQYLLQLLRRFLTTALPSSGRALNKHSKIRTTDDRPPLIVPWQPNHNVHPFLYQKISSPNYQILNSPAKFLARFFTAEVTVYATYLNILASSLRADFSSKIKTVKLRYGSDEVTNVYDVKDVGDVIFTEYLCSRYDWGPVLEIP